MAPRSTAAGERRTASRSGVAAWRSPTLPITLGISSCLLGEEVRYDGGHKKDSYVTGVLSQHFAWVSVCPEMEIGLGTPRESVRLVGDPAAPRMIAAASGTDHTAAMNAHARQRVQELARQGLSGYILKRGSPSCGMERVKVYADVGVPRPTGRGLFARVLIDALPLLPVEEEGRLSDPVLRDSFITRVFSYRRLTALRESDPAPADVVAFHAAHKHLLLSHSPADAARLGRLVAAPPRTRRLPGSTSTAPRSCAPSRSARRVPSTSTCSSTSWAFSSGSWAQRTSASCWG